MEYPTNEQKHLSNKTLVAAGCSFTFEVWNWPTWVVKETKWNIENVGMGSIGNGLISKRLIYKVNELLKTKKPEDIVVGVMWSGIDRTEFYCDNCPPKLVNNYDGWLENPTGVVRARTNLSLNKWVIGNIHWEEERSKLWYGNFHTPVGAMVQTLEHILRVQWFLEKHNIKYFMTSFLDIFNIGDSEECRNNEDAKYLYDMVNFDNFLPVNGCYEWVMDNYKETGGFNKPDMNGYIGIHPTKFGHQKFSEEIILPYLKTKGYI